jgi:hypothetical protein
MLKLESADVPQIGEYELLIKIHAVSLNFRDLMIAKVILYTPIPSHRGQNTSEYILLASERRLRTRVNTTPYCSRNQILIATVQISQAKFSLQDPK